MAGPLALSDETNADDVDESGGSFDNSSNGGKCVGEHSMSATEEHSCQVGRAERNADKEDRVSGGSVTSGSLVDSGSESLDRVKTRFYIGSDAEDDGEWITVRRG